MPNPTDVILKDPLIDSTAGGTAITLGAYVGAISIKNDGPNTVYLTIDGTTVPVATRGTANQIVLALGETWSWPNLNVQKIIGICAAAETARVKVSATRQEVG